MLKIILELEIIYYTITALFILGLLLKMLVSVRLKNLVTQAKEMNKSTDPLLKLIKAKFEHTSLANDGVENVDVFVDKYLREYKICGLSIHALDQFRKIILSSIIVLTVLGALGQYFYTPTELLWTTYLVVGTVAGLLLLAAYQMVDEGYRIVTIRIYIIDYLENVMASRVSKSYKKRENIAPEVDRVIPEVDRQIPVELLEEAPVQVETLENKPGRVEEVEEQVAQIEHTEDLYPLQNAFQSTTTGTTFEQVEEASNKQVKKLEMANLLKIKIKEDENKVEEESGKGPKTFNLLEAMAKRDEVEETPNEALIREILQEFMA